MARFRRKYIEPILAQLKQGLTPKKLALSIALATVLGLFPIYGTPTFLCLGAGIIFKLNHPTMQVINVLLYPIYFPLIPFFIRLGERIAGARPVSFSLAKFWERLSENPGLFLEKYGMAGVHSMLGWLIVAPLLAAGLYFLLVPVLKRSQANLQETV